MTINIRVDGADRLIGALSAETLLRPAVMAVAEHLLGKVRRYPRQPHGRPAIWSDDADKRQRQIFGFFARLRSGEITVPYIRTSALAKRWSIYTAREGLEATLVNNTPYGPLVQSAEEQTRFHALTGWETIDDVVDRERAHAENIANNLVQAIFGSIS